MFIPVSIHNEPALICLLTAECQKKKGFSDAYQAAFASRRIVIVLTQTASATNGVNLDFNLPESGKNMDLTCLYLLESRHYYFPLFRPMQKTMMIWRMRVSSYATWKNCSVLVKFLVNSINASFCH